MLKKLDSSRKMEAIIYAGIFLILLLCNVLTGFVADDFSYYFSCATSEPIESVWQIIPSMVTHAQILNGRIVAHSIVQLFMLVPLWVFDLVNSGVFCLHIWLITRFFFADRSNLRTLAVFAGIWLWELGFGQVNLWQDGAVNYLWSAAAIFAFLYPFAARLLKQGDVALGVPGRIGFALFSFLVGNFSETGSSAAILMAFLLLVLDKFVNRRAISKYGLISIAFAAAGYIAMFLAPSQINKGAGLSPMVLIHNFVYATKIYASFAPLIVTLVLLLVICLENKAEPRRILLALVFAIGSLAANYIMIFARYYEARSALATFMFLLSAVVVLIPPVLQTVPWRTLLVSAMVVLILAAVPALCAGVVDIYNMDVRWKGTESYIQMCIAEGKLDVELPNLYPETKYSAAYENALISKDTGFWMNFVIARYYGLNSVIAAE